MCETTATTIAATMRYFSAFMGFLFMVIVCQAAVVPKRTYRNTEEILVPVAIIQDGDDIKVATSIAQEKENQSPAVESIAEAQRRLDEAIVEEDIKEAIQEEQDKDLIKALEEKTKQLDAVDETRANIETVPDSEAQESENIPQNLKELPTKVVVILQTEQPAQPVQPAQPEQPEQPALATDPEGTLRQATQATPAQTTTQQNFVQQLIQNSPLGQFFNQITGQTTQGQQVANDDASPATPAPTLPGLFNPVAAVQNAAQTVVNSTTQAFAGLQQFASNLGNQFQNTLSGLTGQQQAGQGANDAPTTRPPGPIQSLVNTIIGQQSQPVPATQGPLQGLLNIFQGNRPAAVTNNIEPGKEPAAAAQPNETANDAIQPDTLSNEVRDSAEANDSFEQSVQPDEVIVVNDDASQTSENEQERANVSQ